VRTNKTGYHNHINSEEVTELIRQLALVFEDPAIVSILNRLGYRTGNSNTWTEKRVQHVCHTKGFPFARLQSSDCGSRCIRPQTRSSRPSRRSPLYLARPHQPAPSIDRRQQRANPHVY
jgi:hypothetical protein